jgi:hypothetical protein
MRDLVALIMKGLEAGPCRGLKGDVYLAFTGVTKLHIAGFLVTDPGDPDGVIAFLPLDAGAAAKAARRTSGVTELYARALAVARNPRHESEHAIHFSDDRPLPRWVYGLRCVPMTTPWDGRFVELVPFSGDLFEAMASSVKARSWLERQTGLSR